MGQRGGAQRHSRQLGGAGLDVSSHRTPPRPTHVHTHRQVTLIDQGDRFVFKPLLYELLSGAASEEEVAPPFAQLLAPYPVTFLQGRVAAVRPQDGPGSGGGGVVELADGGAVPYDWLVVSLGAETSTFGVPGVRDHALPFSTFQDAQRVRLGGWLAGRRVGCGRPRLSGAEL